MSLEKSPAVPKDVGNSKPNVDDEFFITSATARRNHPKYVSILLTGPESEGEVRSVRPGGVIRFCLQRKEYHASNIDFKISVSPLRPFDKWMRFMMC